jgi:uncharacterized membrane protein
MALVGKLHPLLVHFPIALILVAAAAELIAIVTGRAGWRAIAATNVRVGAAMGALTALAGWRLASSPLVDPSPLLTWHAAMGAAGAVGAIAAALLSARSTGGTRRAVAVYRVALFGAAGVIAAAAHLGAALVWGADFLRP